MIYFSCFLNHSWFSFDNSKRLKLWIIYLFGGEEPFLGDFLKIFDLLLLFSVDFYCILVLKICILVFVKVYLTYLKSTDPLCFLVGVETLSFSIFELKMLRYGDNSTLREFFVVFGVWNYFSIVASLFKSIDGFFFRTEGV